MKRLQNFSVPHLFLNERGRERERESRARVAGNSHVDKMEGERSEKNPSGVRAGVVIMGI
jgi:hypothetical protein